MALAVAAIRTALTEVVESVTGFSYGAFEDQPDDAKLAKLRQTGTAQHWFDVQIGEHETHESSAISNRVTTRRLHLPVTIDVWTGLLTEAQEDDRALLLATIADDLETVAHALAEPNGLTTTAAAAATGIIGGVMRDREHGGQPECMVVEERWDKRWVHSRIEGAVIVGAT